MKVEPRESSTSPPLRVWRGRERQSRSRPARVTAPTAPSPTPSGWAHLRLALSAPPSGSRPRFSPRASSASCTTWSTGCGPTFRAHSAIRHPLVPRRRAARGRRSAGRHRPRASSRGRRPLAARRDRRRPRRGRACARERSRQSAPPPSAPCVARGATHRARVDRRHGSGPVGAPERTGDRCDWSGLNAPGLAVPSLPHYEGTHVRDLLLAVASDSSPRSSSPSSASSPARSQTVEPRGSEFRCSSSWAA
jgi:hypothetical protein